MKGLLGRILNEKDSVHLDMCIPYAAMLDTQKGLCTSCTFREIGNTSVGFLCSMNITRVYKVTKPQGY